MVNKIKKEIHKSLKKIDNFIYINLKSQKKESVYFYTFHKCASTLFSSYILKNVDGLKHKDYAIALSRKENNYNKKLNFHKTGFIYGPIRISAYGSLVKRLLVSPTTKDEFIKDKIAIFFVRDPRDILISKYYSFGYTHRLNPLKGKKEELLELRKKIQDRSIDDYVLDFAIQEIENFNEMIRLSKKSKKFVILKYEDLVQNFDSFIDKLTSIIELPPEVINQIYERSRPKKQINNTSHRRSGSIRQFEQELKTVTIKKLNLKLDKTLKAFDYRI